jgi:ABC-type nitrate/sulfonate/bicarbonate transport system substrate-binding protein
VTLPASGGAASKKVPTSTGIDASFAAFVAAAARKIFEKYGPETNYELFEDGNVALHAVRTGSSDIGSTGVIGGLARWDKGGKLYVTLYRVISRQQIGPVVQPEIKQLEDLLGKSVGFCAPPEDITTSGAM